MRHEWRSKMAEADLACQALHAEVATLAHRIDKLNTDCAPTAEQVRKLIVTRRSRSDVLGKHLFADPAWDILLEAYATELEHQRVSIGALCAAAGVPASVALRWVRTLENEGLLLRNQEADDQADGRIELSPKGSSAMTSLLSNV